jgi:hypothetical protein
MVFTATNVWIIGVIGGLILVLMLALWFTSRRR